jgi:hypothetical protein
MILSSNYIFLRRLLMDPKIWGAPLWTSMINIAKVYPKTPTNEDITYYKIFYSSLAYVLPCYKCRKNYQNHLQSNPIQLSDRQSLLTWIHRVYNQTREQVGLKPTSYEGFINKYTTPTLTESMTGFLPSFRNSCIFVIILLLIFAIYYYFVYNEYYFPFSLK